MTAGSKLRVVHVTGGLRTGCTRVVLNLVRAADRRRIDPALCFFAVLPAEPAIVAEARRLGAPHREVVKRGRYDFSAVNRLASALRSLAPDAVALHGFGTYSLGAFAARQAGIKTVLRVEHSPELYGWHYRLLSAASAACCDATVAVSQYLLDYVAASGTSLQRPAVVPNGVELAPLLGVTRAPFADGAVAPVVLMVARLDVAKDHATLIDAAALLAARGRSIRLLFAGDGPLRETLRAQGQTRGVSLELLGHVSDLPALLGSADVAVLSTHYEGFPLAVVEAMAAARPVVATRVASLPELIDDGRDGLLVPPGDAAALAAALSRLLDDPAAARALGERARERARQRYSLLTAVRAFEAQLLAAASR